MSKFVVNTEQGASKASKREPEYSGNPYDSKKEENSYQNEAYNDNQNGNNEEFLGNRNNENYNELPPASPAIANLENMIKSTFSK